MLSFSSNVLTQPKLAVGTVTGVNFSKISMDPFPPEFVSIDYKTSAFSGLVLSYYLTDKLQVNFEPSFIERGAEYEVAVAPGWNENYSYSMYYITLPLVFKEKIYDFTISPVLLAGFEASYLYRATYENADYKDEFNNWDFGLDFGAGFEYIYNDELLVTARLNYHLGVVNIIKDESSDYTYRNEGFEFSVGILGLYE